MIRTRSALGVLRYRQWRDEDGFLHREDGPAIEMDNGFKEWWVHGHIVAYAAVSNERRIVGRIEEPRRPRERKES